MTTNSSIGLGWGFGAAGVAVVSFGSNFVPVKKFETGDGMFFQFIMCNSIMLVGVIVNAIRNFPPFYPGVMIGGVMWATGNICVIPIVKTIGLGLGILIWATTNMLCGWASGRFGLFGINQEVPPNVALNYVGVVLCAVSGVLYIFVKTEVGQQEPTRPVFLESNYCSRDDTSFINPESPTGSQVQFAQEESTNGEIWDRLSPMKKRIFGCSLAAVSGVLYGFQFVPYLKISQQSSYSQNALDYVFAQLTGTWIVSFLYFVIYAMFKKNKPVLYPRSILPGVACGLMWSVGDVSWFVANQALGETISFPIITTSPPVVANLWTILLFKEVKGLRNFIIMGVAFLVTCVGVILIVFSKV